jgi:hypothetical protein
MIGRKILFVIVAACFALMPQSSSAQRKVAVEVKYGSRDSVGSRLAYQLKERIRRAAGLRLTNIGEDKLVIRLITEDIFGKLERLPEVRDIISKIGGKTTIYSYTITYCVELLGGGGELFLETNLGVCGADSVTNVAEAIVTRIDEQADIKHKALSK